MGGIQAWSAACAALEASSRPWPPPRGVDPIEVRCVILLGSGGTCWTGTRSCASSSVRRPKGTSSSTQARKFREFGRWGESPRAAAAQRSSTAWSPEAEITSNPTCPRHQVRCSV